MSTTLHPGHTDVNPNTYPPIRYSATIDEPFSPREVDAILDVITTGDRITVTLTPADQSNTTRRIEGTAVVTGNGVRVEPDTGAETVLRTPDRAVTTGQAGWVEVTIKQTR